MTRYKAQLIAKDLEKKIKVILFNWEKDDIKEDDYSIRLSWKFNQCQIIVFIFWSDTQEGFRIKLITPRGNHDREWRSLSGNVVDLLIDTLASFATIGINEKRK